jgi:hypothetical protein
VAHDCPRDGTPAFGCSSCYAHLKAKAMRGGALTEDERVFVGFPEPRPREPGWHEPSEIALLGPPYENDAEPSAEDVEILQKLMAVGTSRGRLDFLGG